MKTILIIGCYFGKLRMDAPLFLKSIGMNPTINWLLFSDCDWGEVPDNVKIVKLTFRELRDFIQGKYDFAISLEAPYKLCDFKPAYGDIFGDYVKGYDFWGHCDFDMVFGNLRKFFTEDKLKYYDRIYYQGHLSIYRNTEQINNLYKSDKGKIYYKDAFSSPLIYAFDEVDGMYHIIQNEAVSMFCEVEYIDVYPYLNVMLHPRKEYNISRTFPKNYRRQVFGYEQGAVYKWYLLNGETVREEFAYIHYSHKEFLPINENRFFFTSNGLIAGHGDEIPFQKYIKGIDELRMNIAELNFRLRRKLKKIRDSRKTKL